MVYHPSTRSQALLGNAPDRSSASSAFGGCKLTWNTSITIDTYPVSLPLLEAELRKTEFPSRAWERGASNNYCVALYPGPRNTRPGLAPVYLPSSRTSWPLTIADRHVGDVPRRPRPIDDSPVLQDQIIPLASHNRIGFRQRRENREQENRSSHDFYRQSNFRIVGVQALACAGWDEFVVAVMLIRRPRGCIR